VQTIVALLETHGQGGACSLARPGFTYHNSFIVADPRRAFVLETAGRFYAIEEIRGARSISNGLTIDGFAQRHSDRIKSRVAACSLRQGRTQHLAEQAAGPAELMRVLRDHGEGHSAPKYSWLNGGLGAPCVHAGGLVASSQTTASWVADLRNGALRHWVTATAAPCTSLFKPAYVTQPVDVGPAPGANADDSLWWQHERLHRIVMRDPDRLLSLYASERADLETVWLADPPDSQSAFNEAARLESDWTNTVLAHSTESDVRPRFVQRYWEIQSWRAALRSRLDETLAAADSR
jgi:secernin